PHDLCPPRPPRAREDLRHRRPGPAPGGRPRRPAARRRRRRGRRGGDRAARTAPMRALVATGLVGAGAAAATAAGRRAPTVGSFRPVATRLTPALAGMGREGHVALTFDDGPDPASTPRILEALDGLGWTATFFMLGEMVRRAPSLAGEVAAAGHEVAV